MPSPSVQPPEGLREIVATAINSAQATPCDHDELFKDFGLVCPGHLADAVLAALFDACEVREQFGVRMEGEDADFWPYEPTRERAEKAIASRAKRNWPASHVIRRCDLRTHAECLSAKDSEEGL